MKVIPPEFLNNLNDTKFRGVLELYSRARKVKKSGQRDHFYNRWRHCFNFTPWWVNAIVTEMEENPLLKEAINASSELKLGEKNYLRSASRRVLVLSFAMAVHLQAFLTGKPADEIYNKYVADRSPELLVEELTRQLHFERELVRTLSDRVNSLETKLMKSNAKVATFETRPSVIIKRVIRERKPTKRSKKNIE